MIHLPKSQPAPQCLEAEKAKADGDYKCGEVLERIQIDFKNKCYLCEAKGITTINVEHFVPHRGDTTLKFNWDNLFFACGHCNNTKLANKTYDDILNCTIAADAPDRKISFKVNPFPKQPPVITALENSDRVKNTVTLLNNIYNGTTLLKKMEADNLRDLLIIEIRAFQDLLFQYQDQLDLESPRTAEIAEQIRLQLGVSSPFTAFKRWVIKDNEYFNRTFGIHC